MGLFKKNTWFGKAEKAVKKAVGKVADVAGGAISVAIPGVGPIVGGLISGVLGSSSSKSTKETVVQAAQQASAVLSEAEIKAVCQAVARDGKIDVGEIESTLKANHPTMSEADIATYTTSLTQMVSLVLPAHPVDDTTSNVNIPMSTKLKSYWDKYKWFILAGIPVLLGFLFFMSKKK